jgi:carbon storage regulator CsrA
MLVLSRRLEERICFPDIGAFVQVVAIKPNLVRLAIEAPPAVAILREELLGLAGVEQSPDTPPGVSNGAGKTAGQRPRPASRKRRP